MRIRDPPDTAGPKGSNEETELKMLELKRIRSFAIAREERAVDSAGWVLEVVFDA